MNRCGVYAGQSVAVLDLVSQESRRGLEGSNFPTPTCERCGWPVGSVGCEVNCGGSPFFPIVRLRTPTTGFVYIGWKFAKEA
jgi:hypothetical protein